MNKSLTMIEVIQPTPLRLTEEDLERYVWDRGRGLTRLVGLSFRKGSTGYTYFAPRDIRMREGQWAPVSPSFFWGLNDDEVKRSVLSAALYYIWPEEVPAYTELWLGDMSSHFPYNLQIILKTELRDVEVWVDEKLKLVNCYFPKDIFKKLQGFHKACIRTLSNNGPLTKLLIDNIDFKRDEECIQFNFRKVGEILQPLEKGYELNNLIRNIYGRYEIERVVKALESKLQESKLQASPNSSKLKDLAAILIKLLLIGPECGTALHIIGPKQFKFIGSDGRCRYLGVFGALVRVYGDCEPDLEERLRELYPAAYLLTSNVGFRVTSHFLLEFLRAESIRSAVAAIMGRNMSHNIGSHVLASPDLLTDAKHQEIQTLHNFIQQRMDFISQVVTYVPSWGEPLYFFQDLMRGFLTQYLLLGHLVKDQGYDASKIDFHIHCAEQPIQFSYQEASPGQSDQNQRGGWYTPRDSEDFLIAVPGGLIGSHAFYDILENTMRNSAKYGKRQDKMEVHIQLEEQENCYVVTLWDNLSLAEKDENGKKIDLVGNMNEKLKEPLIDESGQVVAESRGVHEMKECARILTVPYEEELHFELDKQRRWLHIQAKSQAHNSQNYLAYQFYLQKARLVGIYGREVQNDVAKKVGVFSFENREELKKHPHQFTLIFADNDRSLTDVLKFIGKNHHLLPYRLLVITDNQNVDLNQFGIPKRRVYLCNTDEVKLPGDDQIKSWEDFIIQVYELWLNKFKPVPNEEKWQLIVSFERDEGHHVFGRWNTLLQSHQSQVVNVHLYRAWRDRSTDNYKWITCSGNAGNEKCDATFIPTGNLLAYDNHARLRSALESARRRVSFYRYQTSGRENLKIHQALESPPGSSFGFRYFILGLLEALLTDIVVVDERVGEAILQGGGGSFADLTLLLKLVPMGYYPIFSICKGEKREYVSDLVGANELVRRTDKEGLNLSEFTYNFPNLEGKGVEGRKDADLIIIHQGVVDRLKNLGMWEEGSNYPQLEAMYQIAPVVVITSGRGRTLRHVPSTMPFIEFSIIRENTYPSQSKYHLVRALLSIHGVEEVLS